MADNEEQGAALMALIRKHKVALGVGAVVLVLIAMGDEQRPTPAGPDYVPAIDSPGTGAPDGFDKRKWDEDQRRDDEQQRRRIDGIREVERCADENGRIVEVPAGTCT